MKKVLQLLSILNILLICSCPLMADISDETLQRDARIAIMVDNAITNDNDEPDNIEFNTAPLTVSAEDEGMGNDGYGGANQENRGDMQGMNPENEEK